MRDVLGTIQADQDAIIRAGSRGALVVDGGPGTGKTVVALHRTAYLLYADPRLGHRRGGVLFVGPHQPYLAYVADVLPSLGEEGVRTCTLRELVPEGATAAIETDPEVARLKASADLVQAIEPAVRLYEEPPTEGMEVETPWGDVWLSADEWAEAFESPDPGTPHNEARDQIWEELVAILADKLDDEEVSPDRLRRSMLRNEALVDTLGRSWPLLEAADLVGDLWSVPAYLRMCAPSARPRAGPQAAASAAAGLDGLRPPLLDAARQRLGDPSPHGASAGARPTLAAEREEMARVVDDADRHGRLRPARDVDAARGRPARQVGRRGCPAGRRHGRARRPVRAHRRRRGSGADRRGVADAAAPLPVAEPDHRRGPAQARHGFTESWQERLARVGLAHVELASSSINYRTPEEVMAEAEPVIRAALPDANVPTSIRSSGSPRRARFRLGPAARSSTRGSPSTPTGSPASISVHEADDVTLRAPSRVPVADRSWSKGMEFDLAVLVDPDTSATGIEGAVDRYVAMTRATQRLVVLSVLSRSGPRRAAAVTRRSGSERASARLRAATGTIGDGEMTNIRVPTTLACMGTRRRATSRRRGGRWWWWWCRGW